MIAAKRPLARIERANAGPPAGGDPVSFGSPFAGALIGLRPSSARRSRSLWCRCPGTARCRPAGFAWSDSCTNPPPPASPLSISEGATSWRAEQVGARDLLSIKTHKVACRRPPCVRAGRYACDGRLIVVEAVESTPSLSSAAGGQKNQAPGEHSGEVNRGLEHRTDRHGCLHWFAGGSGVASMGEG